MSEKIFKIRSHDGTVIACRAWLPSNVEGFSEYPVLTEQELAVAMDKDKESMIDAEFELDMPPDFVPTYFKGTDKKQPSVVVQVVHGLAEHCGRYEYLAKQLNKIGWVVVGSDHRGHGITTPLRKKRGYLAKTRGWDLVVADIYAVNKAIRQAFPQAKVVMLGHSMGSFIARDYAANHGTSLAGLALSGTGPSQGILGAIGRGISRGQRWLCGYKSRGKLQNRLMFDTYNAKFAPLRTKSDWLSRDEKWVDAFLDDPLAGTLPSASIFDDLLYGIEKVNRHKNVALISPYLPIWIASGEIDPVGGKVGVEAVAEKLFATGHKKVTVKLYKDGRHEIFGEINRDEVIGDFIKWIKQTISL